MAHANASKVPSKVDKHVGERIRKRRHELQLSQTEIAQEIGLAFQQLQKYETGKNRIPAGRLYEIAIALAVDVTYFFEGAVDGLQKSSPSINPEFIHRSCMDKESQELLKAFESIKDEQTQLLVKTYIENIAKSFGRSE